MILYNQVLETRLLALQNIPAQVQIYFILYRENFLAHSEPTPMSSSLLQGHINIQLRRLNSKQKTDHPSADLNIYMDEGL